MTVLPSARKVAKSEPPPRACHDNTGAPSCHCAHGIGRERKPASIRPPGPVLPLGPNGGEIAAGWIAMICPTVRPLRIGSRCLLLYMYCNVNGDRHACTAPACPD